PWAHALLADAEHPGEDDVEAVGRVALDDRRVSRLQLLAVHPRGQLRQLLAGQLREQAAAVQLVDRRGDVSRHRARIVPPWVESTAGTTAPDARRSWSIRTSASRARSAVSSRTRTPSRPPAA